MFSKRKILVNLVLCTVFIIGIGLLLYQWSYRKVLIQNDMVEVNHIVKATGECMDLKAQGEKDYLNRLKQDTFTYDFVITTQKGEIIYQKGEIAANDIWSAVRQNHPYFEFQDKMGNSYLLILNTKYEDAIQNEKQQIAGFLFVAVLLLLLTAVIVVMLLERNIVAPFIRMKRFAAGVAAGNLDIPLQMDRKKIFGAFTESFDIMREELKNARQKEYEANVSKKELVASLSHDIKTPVTSIKLMSEVLLVKNPEHEISKKLHSIYQKADQIDALVTDMFQSTLEELGELKVNCREVESSKLPEIVQNADFYEKVRINPIPPDCILQMDVLRMQQVIGNVINNSYKYAGTEIEINYEMQEECLLMRIKDFGQGVDSEELPHIFQKFYRGKDAAEQEKSGAGLGLHICREFMEKMEGSVSACNCEDGFAIELQIKLV